MWQLYIITSIFVVSGSHTNLDSAQVKAPDAPYATYGECLKHIPPVSITKVKTTTTNVTYVCQETK